MIGRTFGHYRITDKLGEGGMGVVFLAQDLSLGRKVALKFLSEELRDDPAAHRHQLIEARAAAALDHSGICNIHEIVEAEGRSFIVMEYVDGQSLKERLRAGPLPISEALQIASEVAEALEEAHKGGILHRDLKPANIMLTRKGHAKVMDFGLAKQLVPEGGIESREETITAMTRSRTTVGTLAYMAPEQLRGQPADPRSDVWSLGMVLYEMAAGERPFRGRTAFELSCAILTESPAPLPPHVPPGLRAVIERCLDKEPARRYQRGEEMHAALESVRSGGGTTLRHPEPSRRRSLAVMPLTNLSGDPEQAYFVEGIHEALITDLAKISALRVIARSSSIRCGGAEKSLPEIGRELNVDAVLTGSIARSGNRVRITARLVDAATEEHLWAERYERELHDVLSLQNEIVMSIAREIQLQLTPQEQARLAVARQVNPAAHEAYLKGRFHWYKLSREDFNTALEYFQLALVKDPNYAPAYVGIADVWLTFGDAGFLPAGEAAPKAKAAVLRALELDDALAEAHVTLANVRTLFEWDWAAAETEFRRAIEVNPSHANAHLMYADFLISLRRTEEWEAQIRQTLELDPLNFFASSAKSVGAASWDMLPSHCRTKTYGVRWAPYFRAREFWEPRDWAQCDKPWQPKASAACPHPQIPLKTHFFFQCFYGWHLVYVRRYEAAIAQLRRVLAMQPGFSSAHMGLWGAFYKKTMVAEALAEAREFFAVLGDREIVESLDRGSAENGYCGAMKRAGETLSARGPNSRPGGSRRPRVCSRRRERASAELA